MKNSILNQCTAESFEEAYRVNRMRHTNERRLAAEMAVALAAEGKPVDGSEPEFWDGCQTANAAAFAIYVEETEAVRKRIAERLEATMSPPGQIKAFDKGFEDVKGMWIEALKKNDPGTVVYW